MTGRPNAPRIRKAKNLRVPSRTDLGMVSVKGNYHVNIYMFPPACWKRRMLPPRPGDGFYQEKCFHPHHEHRNLIEVTPPPNPDSEDPRGRGRREILYYTII